MAFICSHRSIFRDTELIYTAITAINKLAPVTVAAKLQQHATWKSSAFSSKPPTFLFLLHE